MKDTPAVTAPASPARMTLSRVVELLLERRNVERSSVTLTRNAKGETQIDVVVRTGDEGSPIVTVEDAEAAAGRVYDRLRARYPLTSGYTTSTKGADDGK